MFRRNARVERRALADEGAIVLQPGGKMAIAGGFQSARKIVEGGVIEFKRNNVNAARGIAGGNFASVAEQTESRHVGNRVNRPRRRGLIVDFSQRFRRSLVQRS